VYRACPKKRQDPSRQGWRGGVQQPPAHHQGLNPELAGGQWEDLCRACEKDSRLHAELRKKREHYLAFLRYPEPVRRTFSTTNAVEAVNGQLEIMRRNNGGYFSSADNLKARLGIAIERLENGKWSRVAVSVSSALAQLNAMFVARFEGQT
jgi:transposase-like protein